MLPCVEIVWEDRMNKILYSNGFNSGKIWRELLSQRSTTRETSQGMRSPVSHVFLYLSLHAVPETDIAFIRMLELIDKALVSGNPAGDSPRDCVFEVYRPDFEHIRPPQDMDLSTHLFTACVTDFEWESDPDDEEGDVPSGRISPCTFLEWSKGCVRWNVDEDENKVVCKKRFSPPHEPPISSSGACLFTRFCLSGNRHLLANASADTQGPCAA
jgi:hypothetical protein